VDIFKLISFCTSYLGRREHLEQTIPHNFDVGLNFDCEFIYIDYSGYSNKYEFSKAKNIAHYEAKGDILINVDADNYLSIQYVQAILDIFSQDKYVIVYGEKEVGGRIAISKMCFHLLGGYDERFKDWGYEDIDLIYRARNLGLRRFKMEGLSYIDHERNIEDRYKNRPLMVYNRDNNVTDWRLSGR
jgi:predicted glycosyltransferase involved in capsule biosynthesis